MAYEHRTILDSRRHTADSVADLVERDSPQPSADDRRDKAITAFSPGSLPEVLTIAESATVMRCSKTHVSHILNGKVPNLPPLPHVKVGRRVLIRRSSLERWMDLIETGKRGLRQW